MRDVSCFLRETSGQQILQIDDVLDGVIDTHDDLQNVDELFGFGLVFLLHVFNGNLGAPDRQDQDQNSDEDFHNALP